MKVLITELIWPEGLEELEAFSSVEYDPQLWRDSEALREKIRSADAITESAYLLEGEFSGSFSASFLL